MDCMLQTLCRGSSLTSSLSSVKCVLPLSSAQSAVSGIHAPQVDHTVSLGALPPPGGASRFEIMSGGPGKSAAVCSADNGQCRPTTVKIASSY